MATMLDFSLFQGEGVTVRSPTVSYDAETKDEIVTYSETSVGNVLFGKPTTEQVDEAMRLYGVRAAYVLGIPKDFTASLRGCKVVRDCDSELDDPPEYVIAGDPQPLPEQLCPTPWNREAVAGWVDG